MESNQLESKDVFQDVIRDYEAARPGYPPELYRDIIAFSKLGLDAKVLEIGSGPGQATAYFVENGYHTTALEISEKQVAFLREKFAEQRNLQCVCSTFEAFESPDDSFDLFRDCISLDQTGGWLPESASTAKAKWSDGGFLASGVDH